MQPIKNGCIFVKRKPRDSRVVQKRLTGEKKLRFVYNEDDLPVKKHTKRRKKQMQKEKFETTNSLAHTKWNCKYHIVFAPKYRTRRNPYYGKYSV